MVRIVTSRLLRVKFHFTSSGRRVVSGPWTAVSLFPHVCAFKWRCHLIHRQRSGTDVTQGRNVQNTNMRHWRQFVCSNVNSASALLRMLPRRLGFGHLSWLYCAKLECLSPSCQVRCIITLDPHLPVADFINSILLIPYFTYDSFHDYAPIYA